MRIIGIKINGINKDGLYDQAAFITASSDRAIPAFERDTSLCAVEALLPQLGSVDTTIEPFRVREQYSTYLARLVASDAVGKHLFVRSKRAVAELQDDPDGLSDVNDELDGAFTASDTTIETNNTTLDQSPFDIEDPDEGNYNVYYIRSETIYIPENSHQGGGSYNNVVRGAAGSTAVTHKKGTQIHPRPPFWISRTTQLFDWTPSNGIVQRDVGKISSDFEQEGGEIKMKFDNFLAGLNNLRVNQAPMPCDNDRMGSIELKTDATGAVYSTGQLNAGSFVLGSDLRGLAWDQTIYKTLKEDIEFYGAAGAYTNEDIDFYVQMGESLHAYTYSDDWGTWTDTVINFWPLLGGDPLTESDAESINGALPENAHFVFALFHPDLKDHFDFLTPPTHVFDEMSDNPAGSIEVTDQDRELYKFHPLAIAAGFLFSTDSRAADPDNFDIFHGNWSLQLDDAFSDDSIERTHKLISETATDSYQIDYLVLGWDSQPVEIMRTIRQLLHAYGFGIGVKDDGTLTFAKSGIPSVEDFDRALENPVEARADGPPFETSGSSDRTTTIEASIGRTPWSEPSTVTVTTSGEEVGPDQTRLGYQGFDELRVDAPFIRDRDSYLNILVSRALMQDYQMPRIKVTAADYQVKNTSYAIGDWVLLEDLDLSANWVWDWSGERIDSMQMETTEGWVGLIVGRKYFPKENSYEIEIIFPSEVISRWRAPSGIIETISSFTSEDEMVIGLENPSEFGRDDPDAEFFAVGDDIQIWSPDGVLWDSGVAEITGISTSSLLVSHPYTSQPNIGDVVELAHLNSYFDVGESGYFNPTLDGELPNVQRAYAFLSNDSVDNPSLGDEALDPDRYSD